MQNEKRSRVWLITASIAVMVLLVFGTQCAGPGDELDDELSMFDAPPPDDILQAESEGKEDGLGAQGPSVGGHAQTAVWTVENQWQDRETPSARRAGLAWGENSGLSWEEKYRRWVGGLETVSAANGYTTFQITNPWGVTLPAPVLECAEVAYFLRATFASWYGLPFFVEARDSSGRIYLGHFGFIRHDGSRYGSSPRYARFADHSDEYPHGTSPTQWPRDTRLAGRGLYGGGDEVPFLGDGARAGAYFDALFLNKRAGYFMLTLLAYFGSIHLADTTITFHINADAIQAGDTLIERWQRRGIGHTIPVMRVNEVVPGRFEVNVASGSMPRRQPVWETPAAARRYFTNDMMGGHGTNSDGDQYAALGGGLRRWRIAVPEGGTWRNTIAVDSQGAWINSSDLESIAARVDRFGEILTQVSPAEQRDVLLGIIRDKRDHLSRYPASCSARIAREEAFHALYELMQGHFGRTREQVDAEYRTLADYVFAELVYNQSRTCCWNSSNADMYRLIMDYNRQLQESGCRTPFVFMMRDGGYETFRAFAESRGEGHLWRAWSADESCPQQSTVTTDTEADHSWTSFCDLGDVSDPDPDPVDDCEDGNDSATTATSIVPGSSAVNARICSSDVDFYSFEVSESGTVDVTITFAHSNGDIDAELLDSAGTRIRSATSANDNETLHGQLEPGPYTIRVYGYNGAENSYSIALSFEASGGGSSSGDGNDSTATATPISAGSPVSAAIDASGDVDFYRIDSASVRATLSFTHSAGDLDLELLDSTGDQIARSQGTSDQELVEGSGTSPLYLRVYGYSSATGSYTLSIE